MPPGRELVNVVVSVLHNTEGPEIAGIDEASIFVATTVEMQPVDNE